MSAVPTPYVPAYNYQTIANERPGSQLPGQQMDVEFQAISVKFEQIIARMAEIQRDDGQLANKCVTMDSLSDEVIEYIGNPT